MLNKSKLTPDLQRVIKEAEILSLDLGLEETSLAVLVYCALVSDSILVKTIESKLGLDFASSFASLASDENAAKDFGCSANVAIEDSVVFTEEVLLLDYIDINHLLFFILSDGDPPKWKEDFVSFLSDLDIDSRILCKEIKNSLDEESYALLPQEDTFLQSERESLHSSPNKIDFCVNLNEVALQKKEHNIFGRSKEISSMIEILSCKTKSNVILVGEAGVGKTAVVEKLAQDIVNGNVPDMMLDYTLFSLDISSLVAGSKFRGQFEERLKSVLDSFKNNPHHLLFIDEIHTIVGLGNMEGGYDASNIMKPALARGEIRCIGATTPDEYKEQIEKDAALKRRFEVVSIGEPTEEETKKILLETKGSFEKFHFVKFNEEVVNLIVNLCGKFLPYKKFPDKAFDVLDRIGARTKLRNFVKPESLKEIESQLESSVMHMFSDNPSEGFNIAEIESQIRDFLDKDSEWKNKSLSKSFKVSKSDVYHVLSEQTSLPESRLRHFESLNTSSILKNLKKSIVGHDEVLKEISLALVSSQMGLSDPSKPLASFVFVGDHSVGKTHTAECMAEVFLGSKKKVVSIDLSEYSDKHTLSKLIGTTAGYIGYNKGGVLTEKVRKDPSCLVLFENFDKAHQDVLSLILNILNDGCIQDGSGNDIDFTRCITVLTTNKCKKKAMKKTMGFLGGEESSKDEQKHDRKEDFKSEFGLKLFNIVDRVFFYEDLSKEELREIFDRDLRKIISIYKENGIKVSFVGQLRAKLFEKISKDKSSASSYYSSIKKEINKKVLRARENNPKSEGFQLSFCEGDLVCRPKTDGKKKNLDKRQK